MARTINFIKGTDGDISVAIDGGTPRDLFNPTNLTVKPTEDGTVIKLTDETWRQTVLLEDTVQDDGAEQGPFTTVDDLTNYLIGFIQS